MKKQCKAPNCDRDARLNGYCPKHNYQMKKHGRIIDGEIKQCKVENCTRKYYGNGYCRIHYDHIKKHGHILPNCKSDPQIIEYYDSYAELIIYKINTWDELGRCKVDLDDVELIKQYKWHLDKDKYAQTSLKNNKKLKMHRLIMNPPDDMVVDHINHDPLDNRKENLRICTVQQNSCNRQLSEHNKSGYNGVFYDDSKQYWCACIQINRKLIIRYFKTKEEAIIERKKLEEIYFGEFAPKNNEF